MFAGATDQPVTSSTPGPSNQRPLVPSHAAEVCVFCIFFLTPRLHIFFNRTLLVPKKLHFDFASYLHTSGSFKIFSLAHFGTLQVSKLQRRCAKLPGRRKTSLTARIAKPN